MKVFLSWSGVRSKYVAETLREWLPLVLQSLKPWISVDIEKGSKWDSSLSQALKESRICILCLTKDNLKSAYINYEAGAISNNENSKNCTFLFDVTNTDVTNPLASFQSTRYEEDDIFKLISDINSELKSNEEPYLNDSQLLKTFKMHWPDLKESLSKTPLLKQEIPQRNSEDILSEILQIVRNVDKKVTDIHLDQPFEKQQESIRIRPAKPVSDDMLKELALKFKKG